MKVLLYRRDFSTLPVQPQVEFKVERYSRSVLGGPNMASISATGDPEALFELVNHLRAPIEILNDQGDCVWWGYISDLMINTPAAAYGVDLETMANRVAVAYSDQDIRYTTQWSGDDGSIADYGTKELLLSKSEVTAAAALQIRDVYLARSKYPIPVLTFSEGDERTATINCKGWIHTLEWQYYQNLKGREGYEETGDGGREIGEDDRPILAQSFQIAAATAWAASSVWLNVWKGGSVDPTDSLVVSLKEDNAGEPGTTLASGQIGAAAIDTKSEWMEFVLDSVVTLQPSTTYWVHVARSGAVTASNYFMVDTNFDAGYPRGVLFLYNTNLAAWGEDIYRNWGDLIFMIVGSNATTEQISTLISSAGQFFEGVIIEDESGLASNPYRNGDTSGLYELEQLLSAGTANNRRLLCEVTRNRTMRIYEEPAQPAKAKDSYGLDREGHLLMAAQTPIDPSLCPVGIWCHLQDVIPASVDLSLVSDPTLFLIEEAEYDVANQRYVIMATRNQTHPLDISGVVQG